MELWSVSEVLQAYGILPLQIYNAHVFCSRPYLGGIIHTARQLCHLHDRFGASPRYLALYTGNPNTYEVHLREEVSQVSYDHVTNLLQDPESFHSSHLFTTMKPPPTTRMASEKVIASRRVFDRSGCDVLQTLKKSTHPQSLPSRLSLTTDGETLM